MEAELNVIYGPHLMRLISSKIFPRKIWDPSGSGVVHALLPCGDLVYCLICDFLVTAVIFITNHIRGRWFVYVDISTPILIERCASLHSIFADTFNIVLGDYLRYGCKVKTF